MPISFQKRQKPEGSEMIYIHKVLKERNCQPRILYLTKLSFKNESEIKTFLDKQKLREFIIIVTRLAYVFMFTGSLNVSI